jgi:integrase
MASVFKPKGSDKYVIVYRDENRRRRKKIGTKDKAVTERIARDLENKTALRKEGLIDPREEAYASHASASLSVHLAAWKDVIRSKGGTEKHVVVFSTRAARVMALAKGAPLAEIDVASNGQRANVAASTATLNKYIASARLADLTVERVQRSLATLRKEGRSLLTCNHHRTAIRSFSRWCYESNRTREYALRGVTGYNAKEDPRHDRRTIALEQQRLLIEVAQSGPIVIGMTGPARALCYRLAAETGLRYSEIASIIPESFDWDAPSVTVEAAYTKNGQTACLPMNPGLAADLQAYVAGMVGQEPVFPLPSQRGAKFLRVDLKAAGIPYRDASGRVFDFHALRCQLATNADRAGVSPRVVQRLMRHSSLALTDRYTRPRAVDIEAAVMSLPSLKPEKPNSEALAATGTDGRSDRATDPVTVEEHCERNVLSIKSVTSNGEWIA